jgi:thiamine biosynthesis protein ThiI
MTALPASALSDQVADGLHEPCVLLKLGEIVLKGRNRQQFERLLQNNIRLALAEMAIGVRLWQRDGVIVLTPRLEPDAPLAAAEAAADLVAERMRDVMGVVRVCRAMRVAKDAQAAIEAAVALARGRQGSFGVRAKRRDKRFCVSSADLAVAIGSRIQQEHGNAVNLREPDFVIYVEVAQSQILVYTDKLAGQGG